MKILTKRRVGNRTTLSILGIKIKYKNKKDNDNLLNDILKQWETDYNPKKLEKDLAQIIAKEVADYNREIYLVYISTLIENKKKDKASKCLEEYVSKYDIEDLYAFPLVCTLACQYPFADERIKKVAHIFSVLENNRTKKDLEKLLENKSIAIVGNSPNLLRQSQGCKIDEHDLVVRFNNYKTVGFEKDYGSKTNIWVCCQANDIVNRSVTEIGKLDYILYNVDFYHTKLREKCYKNLCENLEISNEVSYIDCEFKQELKKYGIVYPSSGLTALYHLHKICPIRRKNIFGFSFLQNDDNFYEHYFTQRRHHKIKKFIRNAHHRFSDESVLLNELFKE